MSNASPPTIPERFRVSRRTLLMDRFMNQFIKFGGLSVVVAVSLIFVFILIQVWPLFAGAKVTEGTSIDLGGTEFAVFGIDEYGELPFFAARDGTIRFLDTSRALQGNQNQWTVAETGFPPDLQYPVIRYKPDGGQLLMGTDDGRFSIVSISYRTTYPEDGERKVVGEVAASPLLDIGRSGVPLRDLAYGDSGGRKLAAAIQYVGGQPELHAVTLSQRQTLFGGGEVQVDQRFDLTPHLRGEPAFLLVPWEANALLVGSADGEVTYLFLDGGRFHARQVFRPFEDLLQSEIARMDFILGDVSVVFSSTTGESRVWSLFRDPDSGVRVFGHTKSFPPLEEGARYFSASVRNKAFLTGTGRNAVLHYMTTETTRWAAELPFAPRDALIAPRYDRLVFIDDDNHLHYYNLEDRHPVAGWKTYFGKIQYEGQSAASWEWQSTGGRDDFEPKLSFVPLIIGTLKGTFYALIFAVPIALLSAIYTSQFLRPGLKRFIKPTMEIMASLPSVVLGFIAALWLAPIVSNAVPSVVLAVLSMIATAVIMGVGWTRLPPRIRLRVPEGFEFLIVLPLLLLAAWMGWKMGPVIERLFFSVANPDTGHAIADFRMWYPHAFGLSFEQRNAFVVGFVMGFAVIPIIFTISEDALSNVPEAFRSGSLALGASRWQTAVRVVLPTASAGIFSALMIGLGRAVGETMIVVMATGNVPVTEFNPFTGMRTLSANIAVELPEAPYLGTLYRTLFLGAMVLFLMTFAVNTLAEILRQRLRQRYRAVE